MLSAANQGVREAAYELGRLYRYGVGLDIDGSEAFKWFRIGAQSGHPRCQNIMGGIYEEGIGTEPDMAKAYFWYALASLNGDSEAVIGRARVMSELSPAELNHIADVIEQWRRR